MNVKLLTEHHWEFLSLKGAAEARLSLHMSKCHIVGNHVTAHYFKGVKGCYYGVQLYGLKHL